MSKFDLLMTIVSFLTLFGIIGGWFPHDIIVGVDVWFLFICLPYLALRFPKFLMGDI